MEIAYRVYNLLCVLHPAFCVLILSLGFQPAVHTLTIVSADPSSCVNSNSSSSSGSSTLRLDRELLVLSSFYFLACASASAFAVVYLFAMDENNRGNILSGGDDAAGLDYARGSDLLFWCFVLASTCVSLGLPTQHPLPPLDQVYLRFVLHFGALFLLCAFPGGGQLQQQLSLSIALLTFLASCFFSTTVSCSQVALALNCIHRFLELLLIFVHRWETQPPPETLYNSRLFFIAFSGLSLHLLVLCLSPSSSS